MAPIQTLHDEDGKLVTDGYWYNPNFTEDAPVFAPRNKHRDLFSENTKWAIESIQKSPFRDELREVLLRYTNALDQSDLDVAFMKLWSLLEKITNTVGSNYDETIKRTIRFDVDHIEAKQILNQMRWRRNNFVHAANSASENDQLCSITKEFVDWHIENLLHNRFDVKSLSEYGEFLSLPRNESALTKMRDWYQRALEIETDYLSQIDGSEPSRSGIKFVNIVAPKDDASR